MSSQKIVTPPIMPTEAQWHFVRCQWTEGLDWFWLISREEKVLICMIVQVDDYKAIDTQKSKL